MKESKLLWLDRSEWIAGPWDNEPDKEQFVTAVGLPGLIVRNNSGALCGYAAVNPGHPLYGKDYDEPKVTVHGGLTYADLCQEGGGHICHIPQPGEPAQVWWFGFDCHHSHDFAPGSHALDRKLGLFTTLLDEQYRDWTYVRREVESLAVQLVETT